MAPAAPQTHYIRISRGGAQASVFFKSLQVISMGSQVREALIYRKTDGIRTKQKSELLERHGDSLPLKLLRPSLGVM